jgi:hypothetical protein
MLLAAVIVAGCGSDNHGNSSTSDTTQTDTAHPVVNYTTPVNGGVSSGVSGGVAMMKLFSFPNEAIAANAVINKAAINVPINTKISTIFTEEMDASTITATTFSLKQGSTSVSGVVTCTGLMAVFAPANILMKNTEYTATITTGAKDVSGNAMPTDYVWSFTTGDSLDTTAPTTSITFPGANAVDVPVNRKLKIGFSEVMDPTTISASSFFLKVTNSGSKVPGKVIPFGTSVIFAPTSNLAFNTNYTGVITTAVKDLAGNNMTANFEFTFSTGDTVDTVLPTVSYTSPSNGGTAVARNANISATFSEPMDPLTVNVITFKMTSPGFFPFTVNSVVGTVSYIGTTATFIPASALDTNTVYTAMITNKAMDLAGNSVAVDYAWSFNTSADADVTTPLVTGTINANGAKNVAVNTKVGATFSKPMDPLSITNVNFTLKETLTGSAVAGTVSYSGVSAVFAPLTNLASGKGYTVTVKGGFTGVKDLAGNPMSTDYVLSWTTSSVADTTAPTITGTANANGAINVAVNTKVGVTFSKGMDHLTITNLNFTMKEAVSGVTVAGTVSHSGVSATFIPSKNLANTTRYTVTIKGGGNGVKDLAGNPMAADYVWGWTTGSATDTTAPTIIGTVNADGATNVAVNTKAGATFSEAMDPLTITNATITLNETVSGSAVPGITSCSGRNVIFTPSNTLAYNTRYTATVKGGVNGAKDLAGNPLVSDFTWSWTTGAVSDLTAPAIILVSPLNLATKVAINSPVTATFNKAMDPLAISTATFKVGGVTGLVAYDAINRIATFTPTANFANGTTYTATITTEATDLAGNALSINSAWDFTTAIFPPLIPLGSAATFGVMARSTITNSGVTRINGDVALSPGTACGLVAGQVSGTIHINDAETVQAAIDLAAAYAAAKALPVGVTVAAGTDLGGFVNGGAAGALPPGTYTSGSTMLVTTPLTLDAKGNVNASWVFQVGSSFTTTNSVLLANGAQAKNVYWVSTASATIGAGTIFNGNIIAGVTVAAQAGAVINGRILSGATTAGSTTLVNVTVNVPAP